MSDDLNALNQDVKRTPSESLTEKEKGEESQPCSPFPTTTYKHIHVQFPHVFYFGAMKTGRVLPKSESSQAAHFDAPGTSRTAVPVGSDRGRPVSVER